MEEQYAGLGGIPMPVPKVGFPEPAIPSMLEEQVQDHSEWEEAEPFSNEKIAAENFRITDEHWEKAGLKQSFRRTWKLSGH